MTIENTITIRTDRHDAAGTPVTKEVSLTHIRALHAQIAYINLAAYLVSTRSQNADILSVLETLENDMRPLYDAGWNKWDMRTSWKIA